MTTITSAFRDIHSVSSRNVLDESRLGAIGESDVRSDFVNIENEMRWCAYSSDNILYRFCIVRLHTEQLKVYGLNLCVDNAFNRDSMKMRDFDVFG